MKEGGGGGVCAARPVTPVLRTGPRRLHNSSWRRGRQWKRTVTSERGICTVMMSRNLQMGAGRYKYTPFQALDSGKRPETL